MQTVSSIDQATKWAKKDLDSLTRLDRLFTRYLWIRNGSQMGRKLGSLTLNYISRSTVIHRPQVVADGYLLRVDLRLFYPTTKDLQEVLILWEQFQFDPAFSRLLTKAMIENLSNQGIVVEGVVEVGEKRILVKTPPYTENGSTFESRWVDLIRQTGPHVQDLAELQKDTNSSVPIVELDYFIYRALSTVKDDGLYKQVWGGLYYDLAGIKTAKEVGDKKSTDLDVLFRDLGIGDAEKGLKAEDVIENARADQRVAVFISKVTGKPREIIFLNIMASRFGEQQGFVIITQDLRDKDVDIDFDPIRNFRKFSAKAGKVAAREVIFTTIRGPHGFALYDGQGARQDEAPPDVVNDHQIPAPYTKRLQGAKSCIICHGFDGSDGLKPVTNDVKSLTRFNLNKPRLDIKGDFGKDNVGKSLQEQYDRFAGQYAGSPDEGLRRGRRDYIKAILRATGPFFEGGDQTDIAKTTAVGYDGVFRCYWWDGVNAKKALYELGYDIPEGKAGEVLNGLLPPDPLSKVGDFYQEDPTIAALKNGLTVSRTAWSLSYSFAALRVKQTLERNKK